jgi:hypothetical protein
VTPPRQSLLAITVVVAFVTLATATSLGWLNFFGVQMVSRGDIQEACYLAIAFDDYFEQQGNVPSITDIQSFPSRLKFLRIEDGRYLYSCGLYGRDLLIIHHKGNGKFNFSVNGNGNL